MATQVNRKAVPIRLGILSKWLGTENEGRPWGILPTYQSNQIKKSVKLTVERELSITSQKYTLRIKHCIIPEVDKLALAKRNPSNRTMAESLFRKGSSHSNSECSHRASFSYKEHDNSSFT
jgi:hypothetical protein